MRRYSAQERREGRVGAVKGALRLEGNRRFPEHRMGEGRVRNEVGEKSWPQGTFPKGLRGPLRGSTQFCVYSFW